MGTVKGSMVAWVWWQVGCVGREQRIFQGILLSIAIDCTIPGINSSGIFQARVLELGAIVFSGEKPRELYLMGSQKRQT